MILETSRWTLARASRSVQAQTIVHRKGLTPLVQCWVQWKGPSQGERSSRLSIVERTGVWGSLTGVFSFAIPTVARLVTCRIQKTHISMDLKFVKEGHSCGGGVLQESVRLINTVHDARTRVSQRVSLDFHGPYLVESAEILVPPASSATAEAARAAPKMHALCVVDAAHALRDGGDVEVDEAAATRLRI